MGEDLFLVVFGQEKRTDSGRKNFHPFFVILKFSEFPGPPPFKNPAYATARELHPFPVLNEADMLAWPYMLERLGCQ